MVKGKCLYKPLMSGRVTVIVDVAPEDAEEALAELNGLFNKTVCVVPEQAEVTEESRTTVLMQLLSTAKCLVFSVAKALNSPQVAENERIGIAINSDRLREREADDEVLLSTEGREDTATEGAESLSDSGLPSPDSAAQAEKQKEVM